MALTKQKGPPERQRSKRWVWVYLVLLTLQYGAQPLVSKRCIGSEVIVTSSVVACELAKVICALTLLANSGSLNILYRDWTLMGSLTASGLPAAIYALQNSLLQISYRNLDSLTFSMLNQTKLLFTALFTFVILRHKQSIQQIGALILLIIAAVLISLGESSGKGARGIDPEQILFQGVIPVLVASVLSGMASALCQWASQVKGRPSYLMTIEMSIVGILCLLASTYKSPDGVSISQRGFFHGWTAVTWGHKGFICQVCEARDHLADKCPFLYTRCMIPGCTGIKLLMESHTDNNYDRNFLKCQHVSCTGFEWLDEAIVKSKRHAGSSSSNTSYQLRGCFHCGLSGHWKKDCPWIATECLKCKGIVYLRVSTKKESEGRRFLKCERCGKFDWFKPLETSAESSTGSVKVTFEGSLDDFCSMFDTKLMH